MPTPAELYQYPPVHTTTDLYSELFAFPELNDVGYSIDMELNERVDARYYARQNFDGTRVWHLASLWLDGRPFGISASAGRGGDDYRNRWITDPEAYRTALAYLRSLAGEDVPESTDLVDPHEEVPEMTEFYGNSLSAFYTPVPLEPSYRIGDVVWARVPENHLQYRAEWITTRVLILSVDVHHPSETYHGLQIDRRWEYEGPAGRPRSVMVTDPGQGSVHARFSESEVAGKAPLEPQHHDQERILRHALQAQEEKEVG